MDLAEITDFIALRDPTRAFKLEEALLEHARRIGRAADDDINTRTADVFAGDRSVACARIHCNAVAWST